MFLFVFGRANGAEQEQCGSSVCEAWQEAHVSLLQSAAKVAEGELIMQMKAALTTSTTLAANASAAQLTGVGEDSAADFAVFISGLEFDIMMIVTFVGILLFNLKKWPIISKNNFLTKDTDPALKGKFDESVPDPAEGYFGWAVASLSLSGEQVEKVAGLDRRMLIEFTHMAMKILASTSAVMILYMAPLNYIFGDGVAMAVGDQLSYVDMGNVKFYHPWLYHVIAMNCIYCSFVVRYFVHQSMRNFVELRFKWLEALPCPRASTVMVEGIPDEFQSDEKLREFFTDALGEGKVKEASVVKHCQALEKLYAAELAAKEKLSEANSQWEHDKNAEDKRPTVRTYLGGREDAIQYWSQEVTRLTEQVAAERKTIEEEGKIVGNINGDSGFVTFNSVQDAEMAKNIRFSADQAEWMCSIPPEPSTVIWQDLRGNQNLQDVSGWIGTVIAFALYALFTPLCIATNNVASATNLGILQPFWASLAPSIGLTIWICFYPMVLRILFETFFELKSTLWSQHKLQSWYFWFQVFFVILVTAVGNNFVSFSQKVLENPESIVSLMAEKMPASTHFYMNYVAYGCVSHVMVASRYMQLFKFHVFRQIFGDAKAKQKAEPEDPDYYGMGSQHARAVTTLSVGLVFGTISPLVGILALVNFATMRLFYGYQVVFAETQKKDLGGVFWVTALDHTQKGMLIYNILMFGVLSARAPNMFPVAGAVFGLAYTAQGLLRFKEAFQWEQLPYTRVLQSKGKGGNQESGDSYIQPVLIHTKA